MEASSSSSSVTGVDSFDAIPDISVGLGIPDEGTVAFDVAVVGVVDVEDMVEELELPVLEVIDVNALDAALVDLVEVDLLDVVVMGLVDVDDLEEEVVLVVVDVDLLDVAAADVIAVDGSEPPTGVIELGDCVGAVGVVLYFVPC